MAQKLFLEREVNGIQIHQRKADGYINATAMSKVYLTATGQHRDVDQWLAIPHTQELLGKISLKIEVSTPKLVECRKGKYSGKFMHPKLAIRFGRWLSDEFEDLAEEWFEEWRIGYKTPPTQAETDRIAYRDNLKDESRLRLTNQVMRYLRSIQQYTRSKHRGIFFARVHDEINLAVTGEKAKTMRLRLSKLLGKQVKSYELIRDYFPAMDLMRYIAVCEAATNYMGSKVPPLEAVKKAAEIALPAGYQPKPIDFTTHIEVVRYKMN